MSDIYYRDTKKALEKFNDKLTDLHHVLSGSFISTFDNLANEVEGLLDQYASKLDDLEHAQELLEDNGIEP